MITPLTRKELNRIKGATKKFNHFMGVMRFKGGLKNVAGCRAFLAYMDNGFKYTRAPEIKAPIGDLSRFERNGETFNFSVSAGRLDVAGFREADYYDAGKFIDPKGYDYGFTPEDREGQRMSALKVQEEQQAEHVAKQSKAAARWRARQARKAANV